MHRIDHATAVANMHGQGKPGFTGGDPTNKIPATRLTPAWTNDLQENLCRVIEAAGIELVKGDYGQLTAAIIKMIDARDGKGLKQSCRVATTVNIVLSGLLTVDGVVLAAGDRVLVKAQAAATENGLYVAAAGAWTRATDADAGAEISHGALVPVEEGTAAGNSLWMVATDGTVTIGTTALAFERVGADSLPLGSVIMHSGPAAPPGYLIANGAAVARATYAQLDAAMYVGDGQNATAPAYYRCSDSGNPTGSRAVGGAYLVLPDYRGVVLRGLDQGRGLDPDGGTRSVNSYQADELKSHAHTAVQLINGSGSEQIMPQSGTGARTNQTNASGGAETRGKNTAVLICIKAFSVAVNQGLIDITALANEVAGKVALTAFTGANQSLAGSGYQKLPGGMIIQWIRGGSLGAASSGLVTLPITFPNGILSEHATQANGADGAPAFANFSTWKYSLSQVRVYCSTTTGPLFDLFAIGW